MCFKLFSLNETEFEISNEVSAVNFWTKFCQKQVRKDRSFPILPWLLCLWYSHSRRSRPSASVCIILGGMLRRLSATFCILNRRVNTLNVIAARSAYRKWLWKAPLLRAIWILLHKVPRVIWPIRPLGLVDFLPRRWVNICFETDLSYLPSFFLSSLRLSCLKSEFFLNGVASFPASPFASDFVPLLLGAFVVVPASLVVPLASFFLGKSEADDSSLPINDTALAWASDNGIAMFNCCCVKF